MANAYSIQRNRQGWIDPTNQEFKLKALQFKDQKYTENFAKVQGVIDKYSALQLARGVDQEYLNERLNYLVNTANQLGGDFGSDAVTSTTSNFIDQALDENVMTAVQQTQKISAYQQEVAKIKEKNPELYNEMNEAFGMQPAQKYLQSTKVGDKIQGSLDYHRYQDYQADLNKVLIDMQKSAKDGVYEYLDGQGGKKVITINGMSREQLEDVARGILGNKYDKQFLIDAWGATGGFKNINPTEVMNNFSQDISTKTKALAELQSKLTGNVTDEEKVELNKQINNLTSNINESSMLLETFKTNPQQAMAHLQKLKVIKNTALGLSNMQVKSVKYDVDEQYWKRQNFNLELDKFNFDKEYKQATLELNREKLDNEKKKERESEYGIINNGATPPTEEAIQSDIKTAIELYKNDETYSVENMQTAKVLYDIAKGNAQGRYDDDQVSQAKALLGKVEAELGTKFNMSDRNHAEKMMEEYVKHDRYKALRQIEINGKMVSAKNDSFGRLQERKDFKASYEEMYKKANEIAKKNGGHWQDTEVAKNFARNRIQYTEGKSWSVSIRGDKAAADLTALLSSSDSSGKQALPTIGKGEAFDLIATKDGNFKVRFRPKVKDNGIFRTETAPIEVIVSKDKVEQVFPEVRGTTMNKNIYNYATMGGREITGVSGGFEETGSKYSSVTKKEVALINPNAVPYVEKQSAVDFMVNKYSKIAGTKENLDTINKAISSVADKLDNGRYVTTVSFSAGVQGYPDSMFLKLVDSRTNETIISREIEGVDDGGKFLQLQRTAPSTLKMILVDKIMEESMKRSLQQGELVLPKEFNKLK